MTTKDHNLSIAGRLLLVSLLAYVAVATTLPRFANYALIAGWSINFATAWFISKAAKSQGKSQVLYGVVSAIAPPLTIFSYFRLSRDQIWAEFG